LVTIKKNREEKKNNKMFLLENKLQSFYDEIKQLNKSPNQIDLMQSLQQKFTKEKELNSLASKNISENGSLGFNLINSLSPKVNEIIVQNPHKSNLDEKDSIYINTIVNKVKSSENGNVKNLEEYDIVKLILLKFKNLISVSQTNQGFRNIRQR
jgi:hypothetical protein